MIVKYNSKAEFILHKSEETQDFTKFDVNSFLSDM